MASAGNIAAPDFAQLYAQLGLRADCSLDEFKQTCRRRIAELHPDRDRSDPALGASGLALDDLLALYVKAVRFHRRHGRLPGAAPQPAQPAAMMHPPAVAETRPEHDAAVIADSEAPQPWRRHAPLIGIGAIVLLLIAIGSWNDRSAPNTVAIPTHVAHQADRSAMSAATVETPSIEQLALDMQPAEVLSIQGEPMQREGDVWEYGPSWLKFERNRLVDWRSSPLHPLKAATPSPPPREAKYSEAPEAVR